ncbi:hypothetical protein ACLOJK_011054 [Asimina triloba]
MAWIIMSLHPLARCVCKVPYNSMYRSPGIYDFECKRVHRLGPMLLMADIAPVAETSLGAWVPRHVLRLRTLQPLLEKKVSLTVSASFVGISDSDIRVEDCWMLFRDLEAPAWAEFIEDAFMGAVPMVVRSSKTTLRRTARISHRIGFSAHALFILQQILWFCVCRAAKGYDVLGVPLPPFNQIAATPEDGFHLDG